VSSVGYRDAVGSSRSASSTARATSTREETSSLRKMFRRCVSTVLGLRKRISAISGLVLRSTTSRAICSSRPVSAAIPVASAWPACVRRWLRHLRLNEVIRLRSLVETPLPSRSASNGRLAFSGASCVPVAPKTWRKMGAHALRKTRGKDGLSGLSWIFVLFPKHQGKDAVEQNLNGRLGVGHRSAVIPFLFQGAVGLLRHFAIGD
jgi:hypothetical protein